MIPSNYIPLLITSIFFRPWHKEITVSADSVVFSSTPFLFIIPPLFYSYFSFSFHFIGVIFKCFSSSALQVLMLLPRNLIFNYLLLLIQNYPDTPSTSFLFCRECQFLLFIIYAPIGHEINTTLNGLCSVSS